MSFLGLALIHTLLTTTQAPQQDDAKREVFVDVAPLGGGWSYAEGFGYTMSAQAGRMVKSFMSFAGAFEYTRLGYATLPRGLEEYESSRTIRLLACAAFGGGAKGWTAFGTVGLGPTAKLEEYIDAMESERGELSYGLSARIGGAVFVRLHPVVSLGLRVDANADLQPASIRGGPYLGILAGPTLRFHL